MSRSLIKQATAVSLLVVSFGSVADDTKEMMERLQKAQVCMQELDRTELKRVESEFTTLQTQVQQLCNDGKADQAQKKALAFAEELEGSLVLKQVKKCAKIMGDMMPELPLLDMPDDYGDVNVCGK